MPAQALRALLTMIGATPESGAAATRTRTVVDWAVEDNVIKAVRGGWIKKRALSTTSR